MGVLAPDLAIARTHGGGFVKGQTADYTITVSNAGAGSTAPVSSFVRSRALRFWPRRIDRWIAYANSVVEE